MSSLRLCYAIASLVALTAACALASEEDAPSAEAAVVAISEVTTSDVEAVIASLRAQREAAPLRPYYADGSRQEGCWRNPAGSDLSELQKAVYCAMPLELRLCNTPVLLLADDVEARYRGYLSCKEKVDAVFAPLGARGMFAYGPEVDAVYRQVFLEQRPLPARDVERIVEANRPEDSGRPFALVLAAIAASLAAEARDLALGGLMALVDGYERDTGDEPR